MLHYLGGMTIGAAIPVLASAELAITAAFAPLLAELNAKLAGYTALGVKVGLQPPALNASALLAAKIAASLAASVTAGFTPPSVNFAAAAVLALSKKIEAQIGLLKTAMSLATQLASLNAKGGVHLFVYEGTLSNLPSATANIQGAAGLPPSLPIYVPIFVGDTSVPGAKAALERVFRKP